jgi:hypothetical protein
MSSTNGLVPKSTYEGLNGLNGDDSSQNVNGEYESDDEPVVVQQTRQNVLKLFSDTNSQWSEYYNITMVTKENEDRQKNASPLLNSQLKQRLKERREAKSGARTQSLRITDTTQISQSIDQSNSQIDRITIDTEKSFRKRNKDVMTLESQDAFINLDQNSQSNASPPRFVSRIPWQTKNYDGHAGIM